MKASWLLQNSLGSFPLPPPIFPGVQQMRPLAPHPSMFGQPAGLCHIVYVLLNPVLLMQMFFTFTWFHDHDVLLTQVVFWCRHKATDLFTGGCSFPTRASRSMEELSLEHGPLCHQQPEDPTTSLFPSRWEQLNIVKYSFFFNTYTFWIFENISVLFFHSIDTLVLD